MNSCTLTSPKDHKMFRRSFATPNCFGLAHSLRCPLPTKSSSHLPEVTSLLRPPAESNGKKIRSTTKWRRLASRTNSQLAFPILLRRRCAEKSCTNRSNTSEQLVAAKQIVRRVQLHTHAAVCALEAQINSGKFPRVLYDVRNHHLCTICLVCTAILSFADCRPTVWGDT